MAGLYRPAGGRVDMEQGGGGECRLPEHVQMLHLLGGQQPSLHPEAAGCRRSGNGVVRAAAHKVEATR